MSQSGTRSILVVDDNPEITTLYTEYLDDDYEVHTAETGQEALEMVSDAIQVVVLDRMLPDIPGDEVLTYIRNRNIGTRVVVVTAVEPDFDIIEMPFDDYLVKPVTRDRLEESVDHLITRDRYSSLLQRYFQTVSKIAALESAKNRRELRDSDEFRELKAESDRLRKKVTDTLVELDDFVGAFLEIERIASGVDIDLDKDD